MPALLPRLQPTPPEPRALFSGSGSSPAPAGHTQALPSEGGLPAPSEASRLRAMLGAQATNQACSGSPAFRTLPAGVLCSLNAKFAHQPGHSRSSPHHYLHTAQGRAKLTLHFAWANALPSPVVFCQCLPLPDRAGGVHQAELFLCFAWNNHCLWGGLFTASQGRASCPKVLCKAENADGPGTANSCSPPRAHNAGQLGAKIAEQCRHPRVYAGF